LTRSTKESYFLDLAAEEGWPKDKLRTKIEAIRRERKDIRETLDQAERRLDNGRQVFRDALALTEDPRSMYERGGETVRSILNKAFFKRLYVDGDKIINHQAREPFDVLTEAYQVYRLHQASKTYLRRDTSLQTANSAALANEYGAVDRATLIDSLSLALAGQGSSKSVMVELLNAYSHSAQADDLRLCRTMALTSPVLAARPSAKRPWSLRERLDEREIAELITAYRDGATAASLATTHGVSLTSIKRLLHTAGIRRTIPTRQAPQAMPTTTHPPLPPGVPCALRGMSRDTGDVG
jgi:hypothetical protein